MIDPRRAYRVDREKERCLRRLEQLVGRLPNEAIRAVNDLVDALGRLAGIPDDELDDTQVGRKRP